MKFSHIAAALTLFASSFAYADPHTAAEGVTTADL